MKTQPFWSAGVAEIDASIDFSLVDLQANETPLSQIYEYIAPENYAQVRDHANGRDSGHFTIEDMERFGSGF